MSPRRPGPTLFPYTPLFRSGHPASKTRRSRLHGQIAAQFGHVSGGLDVVLRYGDLALFVDDEGRTDHALNGLAVQDRKSTRLNSSHANISYAVFCLKKKR